MRKLPSSIKRAKAEARKVFDRRILRVLFERGSLDVNEGMPIIREDIVERVAWLVRERLNT